MIERGLEITSMVGGMGYTLVTKSKNVTTMNEVKSDL
jgi:hypothetical protein